MAPPQAVVNEIERRIVDSLQEVLYDHIEVRVSKQGRNTYLLVHVVVPRDYPIRSIADLDRIRLIPLQHTADKSFELRFRHHRY